MGLYKMSEKVICPKCGKENTISEPVLCVFCRKGIMAPEFIAIPSTNVIISNIVNDIFDDEHILDKQKKKGKKK